VGPSTQLGRVRPARTTLTISPYLSPKNAIAPDASASSLRHLAYLHRSSEMTSSLASSCDLLELFALHLPGCEKSKRRRSGSDARALLADVVPEHPPKRRVQQVGSRVVAHQRFAPVRRSITASAS
jgi:hypothetical protein